MQNIPKIKVGVVAVSRDYFPKAFRWAGAGRLFLPITDCLAKTRTYTNVPSA